MIGAVTVVIVAIGAAAVVAFQFNRHAPTPPATLAQAERLLADHRTAAALQVIADVLQRDPASAPARTLLDRAYADLCDASTGEPSTQVEALVLRRIIATLSANESSASDHRRLGEFQLVGGLNVAAATELRAAVSAGASPSDVALPLAVALFRADKLEELLATVPPSLGASAQIRTALLILRARALVTMERYTDANATLQIALAVEPGNVDIMSRIGMLQLRHGDQAAAAQWMDAAKRIAPEAEPVLRLHAEHAYATRDFAASEADYAKLMEMGAAEGQDPIAPSLGKARAEIYQGKLQAAAATLDHAPLPSDDRWLVYYRALLAYRSGAFRRASELAEPLASRLHGFPPLDLLIGGAMLANGLPETANYHLRRYVAAVPGNDAARALLQESDDRVAQHDSSTSVPPEKLFAAFGFTASQ